MNLRSVQQVILLRHHTVTIYVQLDKHEKRMLVTASDMSKLSRNCGPHLEG
jgi:hypothetical protein